MTAVSSTPPPPKPIHCFNLLDHATSKRNGFNLLDAWQAKHRAQGKRGGITEVTKTLFNVLVSKILPASMEDLARHQPEAWKKCLHKNEFYLFTTIPSIIKVMSGGKKHLERRSKTIYNNINKLLQAGLLTQKVNHIRTGWRNPLPSEANPKGRGKIKLIFKQGLIHIRGGQAAPKDDSHPSFFAYQEQTLPQYELSKDSSISIENKELVLINNTASDVDKNKEALPIGKSVIHIENMGQGSKPIPNKVPNSAPEKISISALSRRWEAKKRASNQEKMAQYLQQLLYQEWYKHQNFNELTQKSVLEGLVIHLETAQKAVLAYRNAKIKAYQEYTPYLQSKRKERLLASFKAKLPNPEEASLEILAHAINKHQKYTHRKGFTIGYPAWAVGSKGFTKAVGLSIDDWTRIQEQYFDKNEKAKVWAKATQLINTTYAKRVLEAMNRGPEVAQATAKHILKRWLVELAEEPHLSPEKRQELKTLFINRIKSLLHD